MPGITGIMTRITNNPESKKNIDLMIKSMLHEKFYSSGTYLNEEMGISVGWVCHKDSFSDCLPIWSERKDICLVFSGEDFTDKSEVMALKARGHQFSSEDASYIVHLYEEMGTSFLEKLNGCFSGLLIDFNENRILLFNDRYGLGRVYYHENDKGFYFSSEAKSLLCLLPELRELSISGLAELFSYGCIFNDKSIFSKISLLPGGSRWSFYPNRAGEKETYFKRENWENLPRLNEENYDKKLKELFPNLLKRYFQGNQKIGFSLTGGVDTRMIMAWAPCLPFKVPCYTFGSIYRDSSDVKIARKVASVCQQRHETISMNKDFFPEFPALAKRSIYYSDGTMDISGSVELYMNRKAREIAPVRLTGNYGDQVLRNVIGFKPCLLCPEIFDPEFVNCMKYPDKPYDRSNENPLSFFAFKQLPWYHYPRYALEESQLTIRFPFIDIDLLSLAYQAPDLAKSIRFSLRFIAEGDQSLGKMATDRGVTLKAFPLLGTVRRLYQAFTFKSEYAYDYGMPQWLAKFDKTLATLHLENLFLGRHKFYHFRTWYRNELKNYVKNIILDPRTLARSYFQRKNLERMVNNHINGLNNYTQEIHWVLTSELIQRNLIEKRNFLP